MQKGDWLGVIIVVAILAGGAGFLALAPKVPKVVYAPVEVTGSAVTVDGELGERSVTMSAELKRDGFVTIHQAIGEAPGPVIGQSGLLAAGSYSGLMIEATEPLLSSSGYFILLFVDDGDGVYESGIDLPVMSDGKVIKVKISL